MKQRSISAFLDVQNGDEEVSQQRTYPETDNAHNINIINRLVQAREPRVRFSDEANTPSNKGMPLVVRDFREALKKSSDMAVAVAAIKALTSVAAQSKASTMMGLGKDLKAAADSLIQCNDTAISLRAGCELFLRYTTRISNFEFEDFAMAKRRIIQRGNDFAATSIRARATISNLGAQFIKNGSVVLVHGYSRVVLEVLKKAASKGVQFSIVVTEGRPNDTGLRMARTLNDLRIPVIAILDSAVAYAMDVYKVDMVLVGAEGVVENGGIINKLGTYTIAMVATSYNKPVYVAAESYKFARLYPLDQGDFAFEKDINNSNLPSQIKIESPSRDYTPPKFLTLLFTDLGVLTPAAVSDELIQLYV